MLKNYFKIAWRNIVRNKAFSAINIFGLAVGFTCCLLISAFLVDELSFDKYPLHSKDIYRVELNVENRDFYSNVDVAVGEGINNAFPEVLASTRIMKWGNVFVKNDDKQFKEPSLAFADSNFLSLFEIPLAQGDVKTALKAPSSIVISKSTAIKYFGSEDVLGKFLLINNRGNVPYKVTGILGELPGNLHFDFNIFLSMPDYAQGRTWSNVGNYTYLQLSPNANVKKLEAKLPQLVAEHVVPEVQHDMGVSLAEARKSINTFKFYLKPISSIHLYSDNNDELGVNGSIKYVYTFAALAIFILLLACVNFTNLSTAGFVKRSKEVGIRKVMGSNKSPLIAQFLTESVMLAFLALLFALGLVYILLPFFNHLSAKNISFLFFAGYQPLLISLATVFIAGVLAGIYPAFFLSSFNIISVLKSSSPTQQNGSRNLRGSLIVFQFAVSIALIICTIVVHNQLNYMQNKELGFDKTQTLIINDTHLLRKSEKVFKQQLLQDNKVVSATISRDVPVISGGYDGTQAHLKEKIDKENNAEIHITKYHVDYDYIKTLGMKIVKGRDFSTDFSTDTTAAILNETAVRDFGLKQTDPIGKTIVTSGLRQFRIIGVVKDFHYASIKQKIAPLVMFLDNNSGGIMVKVKTTEIESFLENTKNQWKSYNADGPFSYSFLDEKFGSVYASEERTGQIFTLFASISIIIAALGLFGLSAYTTKQRTKEIGVRKVLGASVQQVVFLLSKEFLIMVGIALVIATPITWFAMHHWLQEFAYRIDISWTTFILAGIIAIVIAFITVSFESIKAALMNPVKSLRSE